MVLRDGGDIVGVTFRCPHCPPGERGETTFLGVMFRTLIDRDQLDIDERGWPDYMAKHPKQNFWNRAGDTFDTLTLTPSIDCSQAGHWHGYITNGAIT
jgi:Family of unknown function (DUF6527)